jgi:hypothetical protein
MKLYERFVYFCGGRKSYAEGDGKILARIRKTALQSDGIHYIIYWLKYWYFYAHDFVEKRPFLG